MDFVDFDLAKKLKEKGFDTPCIYAYCETGGWNKYTQKREPITYILRTDGNPFGTYYSGNNWNKKYETNKNKIQCSAPTISQVLKWFRDKDIYCLPFFEQGVDMWFYAVCKPAYGSEFPEFMSKSDYDTYEQAALAGITYVLDNLI